MSRRADRIVDALDVSMLGIVAAVPLAFVAWAVQRFGWHAVTLGFPSFCAYLFGRQTARAAWMRRLERRQAEAEERLARVTSALADQTKAEPTEPHE